VKRQSNLTALAILAVKSPHHELHMWYTLFALNTSVVLCGPSGAVLALRLPASSFLRTFYA